MGNYQEYDDKPVSLVEEMEEIDEEDIWRRKFDPPETEPTPPKSRYCRAQMEAKYAREIAQRGSLLLDSASRVAWKYSEVSGCYLSEPNLIAYLANTLPPDVADRLLISDLREIAERLFWDEGLICMPDQWNCCPEMVNLANGVFNMETNERLSHDRRFRFTYQIHADYLEDADEISCPTFEEFCQTSLEGDIDKRQLLLEMIGYICTDTNAGKCALFFKGQPNSGKSVVSEFIAKLFAPELVSNIPLHQLGDRFFRAELAGKKLNVAGEIAGRALKDISIFKSITGNDRIAGEYKGEKPFYFTPRCKLLFSGNALPLTTEADSTAAFVNRIRVLLFNISVPPEKQDKLLLDKLWEERDSIVTLALRAAQQLSAQNFEFTQPKDSKEFLAAFALRGNVLGSFIEECCILSEDARVFNTDLYTAFLSFCTRNGLEPLPRNKFYELLSGIPHVMAKRLRIGSDNRQGHVGIALKAIPSSGTLEQQP